ncbi:class I SAM-dependent methyltransferase [Thermoflavimicrobium dichotomicum]|uniref:Phospholipid N-methyltransferase n=1 Tax=Thermoflavimicrobium dichotomicum TaxID=46223 RepID=A0A1I3P3F9_9BACL|nr:methyltransferase domain-containing protein [Thermoflavimicrobium dichotomicum]SFJ15932.1 Phospholipid N-methyltransferase [Thermoflavimicrobium dichotomicum]
MQSFIHRLQFFSRFILSPRTIGSITPSSKYLVNALIKPVPWHEIDTIVELGAGTGVVTEHIVKKAKPACKTIIFELDAQLRQSLQERFPHHIHCMNAEKMSDELRQLGVDQVDCIISCLPFACFSPEVRNQILDEVQKVLTPDGLFIAYQYSLQMKSTLQNRFQQVDIHFVPFNLPPAFVYTCRYLKNR